MCGIAAIVNREDAENTLKELLAGVHHRGDFSDSPINIDPRNSFGTRRLRILDWKNAEQPQWSFDKQWLLVFNGEIYNYKQLRDQMVSEGITFKTEGDTEVLANGLAFFGEAFFSQINGMFAFVAYNTLTKESLCGRDPLGIKPLYYVHCAEGIMFCSEITPLLKVTTKEEVISLPPNSLMRQGAVKELNRNIKQPQTSSIKENASVLHDLIEEAVKARLPDPSMPLAVMFGGGIDSTLILHFARKYRPDTKAYFVGNSSGKDFRYAMEYAEKTELDLQIVPFDSERVLEIIEIVVQTVETFEPTIVRNAVFSYLLAEQIHNDGIRVALCGEGADELFWGYPEMRLSKNIPETAGEFLKDLHRTQLQRVDRCSMKHTLETRVPFLDPKIVDFARNTLADQKIGFYDNSISEKIVLREVYKYIPNLPESIRKRDKVVLVDGAGMSDNDRFSGPFYEFAQESLSQRQFQAGLKKYKAFNPETEEDVFYLQLLHKKIDIHRIPELKDRPVMNRKMKIPNGN